MFLDAIYPPLNVQLSVDVTAGDKITPKEIEYSFKMMFEERNINVLAYNLETILAEKLETILSIRGSLKILEIYKTRMDEVEKDSK